MSLYISFMVTGALKRIHNYWYVLAAQVILIFLGAFMEDRPLLYFLFAFALLLIYGSIIKAIWKRKLIRRITLFIGLIILIFSSAAWFIPEHDETTLSVFIIVIASSFSLFILIAIISMSRDVFVTDRVTTNRIVGSICIYLLIGMFFTFVYTVAGVAQPNGFNMGGVTYGKIEAFRDYIYFSFVTLTTTGYGDMLPSSSITRTLSILEAIIGPIYVAVMIARLVGLRISQEVKQEVKKEINR